MRLVDALILAIGAILVVFALMGALPWLYGVAFIVAAWWLRHWTRAQRRRPEEP
ncbi:MAG TPA: hypothetical protein VFD21_00570 [Vicinamibacterales bacterium]|jgi:hypothetical protein|nr:hypothetical protein [Vicinamibacterales bacterium]